ncbi:hypothetical protein REPUB_Repub04eG0105000 [Reevesia pubescens]
MDYAMFVINEVYDERKTEELGILVKVTLNALFEHYVSVVSVSNELATFSSQAPMMLKENVDDVNDVVVYALSKYKRKGT